MPVNKRAHTKVTRNDWIDAARRALHDRPIDQLRVLTLAADLDVSRSSFYWYFDDPAELERELLAIWKRNTESIVERAGRTAPTIVAAILGVFECWADQRLYDSRLDLAVRDWGRRDEAVAALVRLADDDRLDAATDMFVRYGFGPAESIVRARLLYHSQVGFYALETNEPDEVRLTYLPYYLEAMAGRAPTDAEISDFKAFLGTTP